jgi:hypothetical protein
MLNVINSVGVLLVFVSGIVMCAVVMRLRKTVALHSQAVDITAAISKRLLSAAHKETTTETENNDGEDNKQEV